MPGELSRVLKHQAFAPRLPLLDFAQLTVFGIGNAGQGLLKAFAEKGEGQGSLIL